MGVVTHRVILGIDPGFDRVGWAVCKANRADLAVLDYGCIQTDKKESLVDRYRHINDNLTAIIERLHPTEAALESLFFAKNQTTAMHVAEARGVIISVLFRHQLTYSEYTPLQIKQAVTGYGRADKASVEKMLKLQLKLPTLQEQLPDDALDALAICLTRASRWSEIGV